MGKDSSKKVLDITQSGILKLSIGSGLPGFSNTIDFGDHGGRSGMHGGRQVKGGSTHKGREKKSRLHGRR
jgi:hypothetical protein